MFWCWEERVGSEDPLLLLFPTSAPTSKSTLLVVTDKQIKSKKKNNNVVLVFSIGECWLGPVENNYHWRLQEHGFSSYSPQR